MMSVMLVDDHSVVRAGCARLLEQSEEVKVVAEASHGEDACRLYFEVSPDVVVMDLSLPQMSGIEATRRIRARDPRARILVLSVHDNPMLVQRAFDAGALGYLTKAAGTAELFEALQKVYRRKECVGSDIAHKVAVHQISGERNPMAALTEREFEIFMLLVSGASVKESADRLHISRKTVSNNIAQIKQKLGLESNVELVRLALGYDLIEP